MQIREETCDGVQRFERIVISPYSDLLDNPRGGAFHRGGPRFPNWTSQTTARHCQSGRPIDVEPEPIAPIERFAASAAWMGPISDHFGHQIADFSMRIMPALYHCPDARLIFSSHPRNGFVFFTRVPRFFAQILEWFEIPKPNVSLVSVPTIFDELLVLPQAEQPGGPGPSASHLDVMDAFISRKPPVLASRSTLFVSRAGQAARFAGESFLENALSAAGVTVIRPELLTLPEQLRAYRSADTLLFSEGSALHSLQLLGRIKSSVVVITRRPKSRLGEKSIRPRASGLTYVDAVKGLIHGPRLSGEPAPELGLSVLDDVALLESLRQIGIDISPFWDGNAYRAQRDQDVHDWIASEKRSRRATVPGSAAMIAASLEKCGLTNTVMGNARR